MGRIAVRSLILGLGVAACGSSSSNKPMDAPKQIDAAPDAKVFNDAPPDAAPTFDLSCIGNPKPTTAAAMVTVSGTATEASIVNNAPKFGPLGGATVDACMGDCGTPLATGTTDATTGAWTLTATTGGTPLDAYIRLTKSGDRTVYEYPGEPLTADLSGVPLFTLTPQATGFLAILGCTQSDTNNGMLGVLVTDCANMPISDTANTTLAVTQGGTAVSGTTTINLGTFGSQFKGAVLICNVPAGTTNVAATYKGMNFLAHDVLVTKGTTTATQVRPGY